MKYTAGGYQRPEDRDLDPSLVDYLCRLFCFELDRAREPFGEHQTAYRHLPEPEQEAIRLAVTGVAQAAIAQAKTS